jgi:hypothetical protein
MEITRIIKEAINFYKNDPVKNCTLYKSVGCSHIDSFLCDFPECIMYKEHWNSIERYFKIKNIIKKGLKNNSPFNII